ncbi:MAG: twin-arginine translocase subunit TatC [Deltaproteobacteria bacterium]|nr:twin-arginine translocase subunit TatC [Deltaproteobacteria bacterium]
MSQDPEDSSMTLMEHLEDLRGRIFKALIALIASVVIAWNFKEALLRFMLRPFEIATFCSRLPDCKTSSIIHWMVWQQDFTRAYEAAGRPRGATLHFAAPTDAFSSYLKLAILGGLIFALPVMFYQLWSFIAPGLYPREKKLVIPFVLCSTLFFVGGALFGYYLVFPMAYQWFLGFSGNLVGTTANIEPTIMMEDYLSFTTQMLVAFGFVFEIPLFIFFIALAGIVSAKQLFSFGRYFTVIAFVIAAILTPTTDIYSQLMLAFPLVILYFVAAALAMVFGPKEGRGFRQGLPSLRAKG